METIEDEGLKSSNLQEFSEVTGFATHRVLDA